MYMLLGLVYYMYMYMYVQGNEVVYVHVYVVDFKQQSLAVRRLDITFRVKPRSESNAYM